MLLFAAVGLSDHAAATGGYTGEAVYTGESWHNLQGGLSRGSSYLDNIDLTLSLDGEQLFGLGDTSFFFYGLYNNSHSFSESHAGDLQVISNIDTNRAFRLYEAWVDHAFADGRALVKAGLFDLNSEFDAKEVAGLFIGSSHGIGPDFSQSGENGPSIFPSTSLAFRADYRVSDIVTIRAALLDGVPNDPNRPGRTSIRLGHGEGALMVGELDVAAGRLGRFAIGTWAYTARTAALLPAHGSGRNDGTYIFWEGRLLGAPNGAGPQLDAYARLGFADRELNPVSHSWQAALKVTGLVAARPDDAAGLAISKALASTPYNEAQRLADERPAGHETVIELTYRARLLPWLTVQPDLQYIIHPSMRADLGNGLAAGLRFELSVIF